MRKTLLLTVAIVMAMTASGVYAGGGLKKNAYSGNSAAKTQPAQERDISGFVHEVSYSYPQYIVIGETQFHIDKATVTTMDGAPASISNITKDKKVKLVIDASGVVTDVLLYENPQ
ncbi:MAG: hypothetical protein HQL05_01920 [Nitrospirae bacterium]|uniref:hypothetical protein n=1 Tax=Candidatus Magnetobacterium casense TaxID=1455061 RepID=UPI00058DF2BE|nr:hypothetical protein [Candidatus Magnetobacterium casensis]MBF0336567.1 hypothetical protein [Nitrospirota bacterium]